MLYNVYMEYRNNNNIVYSCKYHVVWCPKYRRKVLVDGIDVRFKELAEEVCTTLHIDLIEMEVMPDHVHLLLEVDPQFGIHRAVKQIKGYTSRVLRSEFPLSLIHIFLRQVSILQRSSWKEPKKRE